MEAREGDCVITNVGRVAAVAQIPAGAKTALGRNMTGLRCRNEYAYPTFLLQLLMSESMKEEIALKIDSGTILESLNVRSIPRLRFVLPPTNVVKEFEGMCRPFRAKMEKNFEESITLAAIRDTLLPKLISGELRFKADKNIGPPMSTMRFFDPNFANVQSGTPQALPSWRFREMLFWNIASWIRATPSWALSRNCWNRYFNSWSIILIKTGRWWQREGPCSPS